MPWIPEEEIKRAREITAIEYLKKYQPNRLKKSSARNEWELTDHDSFKINEQTMSEIKQLYQQLLPTGGFLLDNGNSKTEENQFCYALSPDKGKGVFWQYFFENMFEITKQDFYFFEDFFLESPEPEFLAVQYYSSVSGEEFHPYYQLSPNSLRAYIGGSQKTYRAVYHKNVPIRSVSISIMHK